MNRSVNILLLVISFPAMFFTIYVSSDLPLTFLNTTAGALPYKDTVFWVFAGLMLILAGRRSVSRWVGVGMLRKPERFDWSKPIGKERKRQVRMYLLLEAAVALGFLLTCYIMTRDSLPLQITYGLLCIDQLIFFFIANSWYRVGITQKALVVADREVRVLYFSGLRRVEVQQQTIYFEYIEDLQLSFPINCIAKEDLASFREALESKLNRDKVYFSKKFKDLV